MRKLILDLLDAIPEEKLALTVGKNMGSLGAQFRHIGSVQSCYSKALKTGTIDFEYKRDPSIENSKERLQSFLEETTREMLELIDKNPEAKINWFGKELSLEEHLVALIEHEILHQGELIVYIRSLDIPFPKSWELWGL